MGFLCKIMHMFLSSYAYNPVPRYEHPPWCPIMLIPKVTRIKATDDTKAGKKTVYRLNIRTEVCFGLLDKRINKFVTSSRDVVVCTSEESNCIILVRDTLLGPERRTIKLGLMENSSSGFLFHVSLHPSMVPQLSHTVAVYDWTVCEDTFGVLILRYPVPLYDRDRPRPAVEFRTHDSQRRASELIQAQYEPLRRRQTPYPFFIRTVPLDPPRPSSRGNHYARRRDMAVEDPRARGARDAARFR